MNFAEVDPDDGIRGSHMWVQDQLDGRVLAFGLALVAGCAAGEPSFAGAGASAGLQGASSGTGGFEDGGSSGFDESGTGSENEVDEYIFSLGHLAIEDLLPPTETPCLDGCPQDGQEGQQWCTYVHYDETSHRDELVAFQPHSAQLWPGNIVQGEDAQHGILTPVSLPRAPMTFSLSLQNLNAIPVGTMESPALSEFRKEFHRILAGGVSGATEAFVAYQMERAYSVDQVANHLGFGFGWPGAGKIQSMFDWASQEKTTRILVDFTQAYYTVDVDSPGTPSDLFTDEVTVDDLDGLMGQDNPPMYIQSITYGRRLLFSLESNYSEHEVRNAVDLSIGFVLGQVDFEVASAARHIIDESKMEALVLGGSGESAVKVVTGFEGLLEYILEGGNYSKNSPGAPIAYKLAYLDNNGVKLAFTSDWAERHCFDTHVDVTAELTKMRYNGGNDDGVAGLLDVYGDIEFRVGAPGEADPCNPGNPGWLKLFDRGRGSAALVVGTWSQPVPTSETRKTIHDLPVDDHNTLCFRGKLREADHCWFCGDDDLGSVAVGPLEMQYGWVGDHNLQFTGGSGDIQATVKISLD